MSGILLCEWWLQIVEIVHLGFLEYKIVRGFD